MNIVVLYGRLGKDPEVRTTNTSKIVCKFPLAVDRYAGEGKKEADFFNIVVWGNVAEACGNNLEKGQAVAVSGRLQTRSYTTNSGEKRYVTEVVAQAVDFGAKPKGSAAGAPPNGENQPSWDCDDDIPF
jgi:single-strand DNA-binding protein